MAFRIPAELQNKIRAGGYEFLGQGAYAIVYKHSARPKQVLKVIQKGSDPKFERYLKWCQENQENPHVPKICKVTEYKFDGDVYLMIGMERLGTWSYAKCPASNFFKMVNRFFQCRTEDCPCHRPRSKAEVVAKAVAEIAEVETALDIYNPNIMRRGRTMVVTDPVYSGTF